MNISKVAAQTFTGEYRKPTARTISKETGYVSRKTLSNKEAIATYDTAMSQIAMRNKLALDMHKLLTEDSEVQETLKTLPEEVEIDCTPDFFLDDRRMMDSYADRPLGLTTCYLCTAPSGEDYPDDYDDFGMDYDETTTPDEIKNWLRSLPKAQGSTNGAKVVFSSLDDIDEAANLTIEELQEKKQIAEQLLEFFDSKEIQDLIASLPDDKVISAGYAACTPSENVDEDIVARPEFCTPSLICYDRTKDDLIDFEGDIAKNGKIDKQAIIDWLNSLKD